MSIVRRHKEIASFPFVTSRQCHDKAGRLLAVTFNQKQVKKKKKKEKKKKKKKKIKPDQSVHSRNLISVFVLSSRKHAYIILTPLNPIFM